jgi:hypothetical protein
MLKPECIGQTVPQAHLANDFVVESVCQTLYEHEAQLSAQWQHWPVTTSTAPLMLFRALEKDILVQIVAGSSCANRGSERMRTSLIESDVLFQ